MTREFYQEYNLAFALAYKKNERLGAHGGSFEWRIEQTSSRRNRRARGRRRVPMNQETDIEAIAKAGLIANNWRSRLPNNAAPYTSTIVFLVRKGNPKGIKDWGDLVSPGVSSHRAESQDVRQRALQLPCGVGLRQVASRRKRCGRGGIRQGAVQERAGARDRGRAATNTFVQKEIGDVLLTFESEVLQITKVFSPEKFDIVYPPLSILAEAPVSVVDKVVDRRGTRKLATAYLEYLWSDDGQKACSAVVFPPSFGQVSCRERSSFSADQARERG